MKRSLGAVIAAMLCTGLVAADADAQRRDRRGDDDRDRKWVDLGCKEVNFITDRDVLFVGRKEGRFKAIRLEAKGNDVEMLDLKVHYTKGGPDDIRVRSKIKEGTRTRPLDLRGRERAIQKIEMVYRRPLNFRGKARICVEALD